MKSGAFCYLYNKDNNIVGSKVNINRISGTNTDGIYTATFTVPKNSLPGKWYIRLTNLYDNSGNECGSNQNCYFTVVNTK